MEKLYAIYGKVEKATEVEDQLSSLKAKIELIKEREQNTKDPWGDGQKCAL